jgi:hypothetical protein
VHLIKEILKIQKRAAPITKIEIFLRKKIIIFTNKNYLTKYTYLPHVSAMGFSSFAIFNREDLTSGFNGAIG